MSSPCSLWILMVDNCKCIPPCPSKWSCQFRLSRTIHTRTLARRVKVVIWGIQQLCIHTLLIRWPAMHREESGMVRDETCSSTFCIPVRCTASWGKWSRIQLFRCNSSWSRDGKPDACQDTWRRGIRERAWVLKRGTFLDWNEYFLFLVVMQYRARCTLMVVFRLSHKR